MRTSTAAPPPFVALFFPLVHYCSIVDLATSPSIDPACSARKILFCSLSVSPQNLSPAHRNPDADAMRVNPSLPGRLLFPEIHDASESKALHACLLLGIATIPNHLGEQQNLLTDWPCAESICERGKHNMFRCVPETTWPTR
jgi:hypothetical protein